MHDAPILARAPEAVPVLGLICRATAALSSPPPPVISAFRYDQQMDAQMIPHDAPINPGNSEGPLFSRDGRVVAVNTYRFSPMMGADGLGFAVLETTAQERIRLWDLGPSVSFGPPAGSLTHDADKSMEGFTPEFQATGDEFTIRATFTNPYSAGTGPDHLVLGGIPTSKCAADCLSGGTAKELYDLKGQGRIEVVRRGLRKGVNDLRQRPTVGIVAVSNSPPHASQAVDAVVDVEVEVISGF